MRFGLLGMPRIARSSRLLSTISDSSGEVALVMLSWMSGYSFLNSLIRSGIRMRNRPSVVPRRTSPPRSSCKSAYCA